jgi:hypothetical protein
MDFRIVLLSQDKTKTHKLDMYGDTDISVVFNIADIREPESIKSNYTKEFTIPATKANNQFFEGMLYNGYYPNKFNPNLKVNAQLYGDTSIIIDGYLQITDIIKNQNDVDAYKVVIYGEIASVFNSLTGLQLTDLDLSEYNHLWNYTNESSSWTNKVVYKGNLIQSVLGKGYVYPFEFRGQATTDMAVEDFFPSIYVKTVWDKIFNKAGKTYTSTFLTSEKFNRLILPFTKSHMYLTDDEIKKREFKAHSSANRPLNTLPATVAQTSAIQLMKFNVEDADGNNLYDSNYIYTPKNKQDITLYSNLKLRMTYTPQVAGGTPWLITGPNITGKVKLFDITAGGTFIYSEDFEFVHNTSANLGPVYIDIDVLMDYRFIAEANHQYVVYVDWTVPAGSYASKFINSSGQVVGGNMTLTQLANSTYYNNLEAKYIFEGDMIDMNQILPQDISINDFLTSINKMFNLYWIPDGDKNFIIEPRDVMYSKPDVQILDWTKKTDRNTEIVITPMAELNNKEYYFHYTPDEDYYNTQYTISNNAEYGDRRITVMNDFVTETSDIQLIFGPTPLVKVKNTSRVAASYVEQKDGYFEAYEPNIRIAVYGGLKDSSSNYWLFKSASYPKGLMQYNYPYAGHFDDPYNPTYDINYGKCKEYYYTWTNTCTNNLFNQYWKNTITDIIAPDSHILKGTLHLRTFDILTLNLFDTIQMDEVFYKINLIDYNPLTETAYVELFKTTTFTTNPNTLNVYTPPIIGTGTTIGGGGGWKPWNGEGYTPWIKNKTWTKNAMPWQNGLVEFNMINEFDLYEKTYSTDMSTKSLVKQDSSYGVGSTPYRNIHNNIYDDSAFIQVSGRDNNIGVLSTAIKVIGNQNRIGKAATNISIVGDNNTVSAGLKNVSIVGDNVIAKFSDTSYINGAIIRNGSLFEEFTFINGSVNEVQNPFDSSVRPNLIKGGFNAVQNIGGMSKINLVKGGGDTVQNPYQ